MDLIIYCHICLVQLEEVRLRDLKRDTSKKIKVGELYREIFVENEKYKLIQNEVKGNNQYIG